MNKISINNCLTFVLYKFEKKKLSVFLETLSGTACRKQGSHTAQSKQPKQRVGESFNSFICRFLYFISICTFSRAIIPNTAHMLQPLNFLYEKSHIKSPFCFHKTVYIWRLACSVWHCLIFWSPAYFIYVNNAYGFIQSGLSFSIAALAFLCPRSCQPDTAQRRPVAWIQSIFIHDFD